MVTACVYRAKIQGSLLRNAVHLMTCGFSNAEPFGHCQRLKFVLGLSTHRSVKIGSNGYFVLHVITNISSSCHSPFLCQWDPINPTRDSISKPPATLDAYKYYA